MLIRICNYKISCFIGVNPEEKINPQTLLIDLELRADVVKAAIEDSIDKTINYETVGMMCQNIATRKKYQLLETLVYVIANELFLSFPIEWIKIVLKKPSALKEAEYAAVEYEKTRSDNSRS